VVDELPIGEKLKSRRHELGISLRKLSEQTNLSASFLNQVEHGKARMSLGSLQAVAEALGVTMLYFLSDVPASIPNKTVETDPARLTSSPEADALVFNPVVDGYERAKLVLPLQNIQYELLVPSLGGKMVAVQGRATVEAGNFARRLREPTEEFLYVLQGTLLVGLKGGDHYLHAGDSIYFKGEDLITLVCASEDEEAAWISVITPPVF
jgi:transcriptional regulator with XRE-family HTH domain